MSAMQLCSRSSRLRVYACRLHAPYEGARSGEGRVQGSCQRYGFHISKSPGVRVQDAGPGKGLAFRAQEATFCYSAILCLQTNVEPEKGPFLGCCPVSRASLQVPYEASRVYHSVPVLCSSKTPCEQVGNGCETSTRYPKRLVPRSMLASCVETSKACFLRELLQIPVLSSIYMLILTEEAAVGA